MSSRLCSIPLRSERDVVQARQRAREIAAALGFDNQDQIRLATATSEMARNAFRYAREAQVDFELTHQVPQEVRVFVSDHGPGIPKLDQILEGRYQSRTGMGLGIIGTRRLMDNFDIETNPSATVVRMAKALPPTTAPITKLRAQKIASTLEKRPAENLYEEIERQNRELLKAFQDLRSRQEELAILNRELEDTNRGVVALYAELDERADYLRRASELKTSFLSNMSHEFRTPLNSMLALTRMLLDRMDGELTSEQDQQIRFIQRSAKELAEMVDDLLDLAKVEAGKLEVKAKSFEVGDLFGALRGMLKPLLAESSLNLVFDAEEDLPTLFTDEQKVSQILRNFISNAIKFTPRGEVRVTARLKGDAVEFAVADTGVGISASDQQIIFEEFGQVENSMQKRVKGTGLGLPLSRKLAELLGGVVTVQSEVGSGSTFFLVVPTVYAGASLPTEPVLPEIDADRKLILILEDNHETAFVYCRYLANAGFQGHSLASVEDARSFLTRMRPAAIILDLLLRAETTWDFLRELKQEDDPIPVLVMSVNDDERKVYGLGADAFIVKPFLPEAMIAEITRLTSDTPRPRILMIDDNEVSRYLLREHIPATE